MADKKAREKIKKQFDNLDKNGDGLLSFLELFQLLQKGNPSLTKQQVRKLYNEIDKDGDGTISIDEFLDYIYSKPGPSAGHDAKGIAPPAAAKAGKDALRKTSGAGSRAPSKGPKAAPPPKALPAPQNGDGGQDFAALIGKGGCDIKETERRGITVRQMQAVMAYVNKHCGEDGWTDTATRSPTYGQALSPATINLYQVVDWIVRPCTKPRQVSYVEAVATAAQTPKWFVSHWWGEPHSHFVMCLAQHMKDRGLSLDDPYWVCAYANNQWKLAGDVSADPSQSSFRRAIDLSVGTVSVLDPQCVCYTRVWCSYEVYVSLVLRDFDDGEQDDHLYDIYTSSKGGRRAVGITDGLVAADMQNGEDGANFWKSQRESGFPLKNAERALKMKLEKAEASVESDRRHILNSMVGSDDFDADPPATHPQYDLANSKLNGRFAAGVWRRAVDAGSDLAKFGAALAASRLDKLAICLNGCGDEASHEQITELTKNLPETLRDINLDFTGCRNFNDSTMRELASFVPEKVRRLHLFFQDCGNVTDEGAQTLVQALPASSITDLCLDFNRGRIGTGFAGVLAQKLAAADSLKRLSLDLNTCRAIPAEDIESLLGAVNPAKIEHLDLRLSHCQVADGALARLASVLRSASCLKQVALRLEGCRTLAQDGVVALIEALPAGLDDVELNLENCPQVDVAAARIALGQRSQCASSRGGCRVYG